jgi:glycosyltransferase involved in cell wall biosynthesis
VQGGLVKLNSKKTKELEIDLKVKTLTYVGNSREYQGICHLTERLTSDNFLKRNQMALLTIIDSTLTIYQHNSIQTVLDIDKYQTEWIMCNSDLLVIPRLESKISRFSFPSKVYDYLSSGTNIIASEAFEELPEELEHSLNRYRLSRENDIVKCVEEFLKTAKSNACKDIEIFEELYSRYSWEAQLKQILDTLGRLN